VGYLCANFDPLCSRLRPDVRDRQTDRRQTSDVRQTDVRQHHRLMPRLWAGHNNKLCRRAPQYAPAPYKLTFDLLTLKVVSESRVMCDTSVPILVFLGLSVLDLGLMYATNRQTDVRRASSLNASALWGRGIIMLTNYYYYYYLYPR